MTLIRRAWKSPSARLTVALWLVALSFCCYTYGRLADNLPVARAAAGILAVALAAAAVSAVRFIYIRAGQEAAAGGSALPPSLRELVAFVDSSAAVVLDEGHAAGVDAADHALDRVGDTTSTLVERATERRVLELAFERNTAGRRH